MPLRSFLHKLSPKFIDFCYNKKGGDSPKLSIDATCTTVSIPVTEVSEAVKIALTFRFGTPAYALKIYSYH
jgi:hypothetical protein